MLVSWQNWVLRWLDWISSWKNWIVSWLNFKRVAIFFLSFYFLLISKVCISPVKKFTFQVDRNAYRFQPHYSTSGIALLKLKVKEWTSAIEKEWFDLLGWCRWFALLRFMFIPVPRTSGIRSSNHATSWEFVGSLLRPLFQMHPTDPNFQRRANKITIDTFLLWFIRLPFIIRPVWQLTAGKLINWKLVHTEPLLQEGRFFHGISTGDPVFSQQWARFCSHWVRALTSGVAQRPGYSAGHRWRFFDSLPHMRVGNDYMP